MNQRMGSAPRSTGLRPSWRWQAAGALVTILGLGAGYAATVTNAPTSFAAAATHFSVAAPAAVTAGTSFNVTVTAQDGANATDATFVGVTTITSSDGAAVLGTNPYTYTGGDAGVHIFAITLNTPGSRTLTFTAGSVTGTATVNVVAPATHLAVVAPASALAGTPILYTVTALTGAGTTATTYGGTVHFTSSDGAAILQPNYTFVAGDNG